MINFYGNRLTIKQILKDAKIVHFRYAEILELPPEIKDYHALYIRKVKLTGEHKGKFIYIIAYRRTNDEAKEVERYISFHAAGKNHKVKLNNILGKLKAF
jgi:hypothetical protein